MTDFLIKSTIPLFILLAVYHLLLEKEKMHNFNRFYLLFSLVFSLVIPFITIEVIEEITKPIMQNSSIQIIQGSSVNFVEETNYFPIILWSIYGIITVLLSIRFMRNILKITSKIKLNTRIDYRNAKLVLLKEKVLPHTFLNNIFINETDYNNQKIEAELFSHELTHVIQKHTFDVLFIEILKTVFWFNPIFIFYKKAIQLNHEFLADEKVVVSYNNVSFYQNLLLSKINNNPIYYLTSNLNYSLTKKRLIMMTKTTSQTKAIFKQIALIPFIFGLVFFLCLKTVAQESNILVKDQSDKNENPTNDRRDEFYAGVRIIFKDCSKKIIIDKQYEQLTLEEKDSYIHFVPKPFIEKSPSKNEFNEFKNSSKYAIWIDGKHYPNSELSKYSASDFVYFTGSSVKKNARNKKFPQPFQYQFYTKDYFDKNLKDSYKKFGGKELIITENCADKWDKTNNFKELVITYNEVEKSQTQISGIEKYFEETIFTIKDEKGNRIGVKKFNELSKEEMKHIPPPPPPTYKRDNQTGQLMGDSKNIKGPKSVEIVMSPEKSINSSIITNANEIYPDFPGGMKEFYKFVGENFKVPTEFKGNGKIYISFMVEIDGSLSEFNVLRDLGFGTGEEAVRVLKLSPKWIPGKEDGKEVRMKFSLPISLQSK